MHFFKLFMTAMVGAASAAPAVIQQREMSSTNVVDAINAVAKLSFDLKVTITPIKLSPLSIIFPNTYLPVVNGFGGIVSLATQYSTAIVSNPIGTLTTAGQTDVCTAFRGFVKIHQELLAVLISKGGLLQSIGCGPIAIALSGVEHIVDTIALQIIAAVPTCEDGAEADAASLKAMIQQAECTYLPLGTVLPELSDLTCPVFKAVTGTSS